MREDKIYHPNVSPMLENHLKMLPDQEHWPIAFSLPQAYVRFTSMVKSLFEYDHGGYGATISYTKGNKNKKGRKGVLTYPEQFQNQAVDIVPSKILDIRYKSLK